MNFYNLDYNEPLEKLMKKRSEYKIKQKLSIKDRYLKIYRDAKSDILKLPKEELKQYEFETFEKQNNFFTGKKTHFIENIAKMAKNSMVLISIQLGTYYECNKLIIQYEKLEIDMNNQIEDKEVSEFIKKFDIIITNIIKQEVLVKQLTQDIQDFKASDEDLDKAQEELNKMKDERDNFKAKTQKEKDYRNVAKTLQEVKKKIEETKIFIKKNEELKKKKITADSIQRVKNGVFDMFKNIIIDEIDFIRNEYDIAIFFSLGITEMEKLKLVEVLISIYLDIFKIKKAFTIANEFYNDENKKINEEIKSGKEQLKFYYSSLEKIINPDDKKIFIERFSNRQQNLDLLTETHKNLVKEHIDNSNIMDKSTDLLFFCDHQINTIKNMDIIRETKTKILTDASGLIDINELHEKQLDRKINLTYKELVDILDDILSYRKVINSSKSKVYKSITNKEIKYSKIKKTHKKSLNTNDKKEKAKIVNQLKVIKKRLGDYQNINLDYLMLEKPIDLLVFYRVLMETVNKNGRHQYTFNKEILNEQGIKLNKKLKDRLQKLNLYIDKKELI